MSSEARNTETDPKTPVAPQSQHETAASLPTELLPDGTPNPRSKGFYVTVLILVSPFVWWFFGTMQYYKHLGYQAYVKNVVRRAEASLNAAYADSEEYISCTDLDDCIERLPGFNVNEQEYETVRLRIERSPTSFSIVGTSAVDPEIRVTSDGENGMQTARPSWSRP